MSKKRDIQQKVRGMIDRELNEEDEIQQMLDQTIDQLATELNGMEREQ